MRKLQTSDVFSAMRLIKKANLKEELRPVLRRASTSNLSVEDVGIEAIIDFMGIISEKNAEQAIYEVLAGPFEITAKEVETMPPMQLVNNLTELAKENDLKVFFQALFGMMSKS